MVTIKDVASFAQVTHHGIPDHQWQGRGTAHLAPDL